MLPPPTTPAAHHNVKGCLIGRLVLPLLDKANRAWLDKALEPGSGWGVNQIADHLTAALASDEHVGIKVSAGQVAYHRKPGCSCQAAGLL